MIQKRQSRPAIGKNSPHRFGVVRTREEQRDLEREERSKLNAAMVRRACDEFFVSRKMKPKGATCYDDTFADRVLAVCA